MSKTDTTKIIPWDKVKSLKAPCFVRLRGKRKKIKIVAFSEQDPLGVGGGIMPDFPCAYFEGGGWLLLQDIRKHYELIA